MAVKNLIYITGTPGSGKTAVGNELKRRGYTAYDTDNDGIAFFYNNATSEALRHHITAQERTPEWRSQHTWKAQRETVEKLMANSDSGPVFLCGVTANDADELWDLFSQVFALVVRDEHVLRKRIQARDADEYGQNPHELAMLIDWQRTAADDYKQLGAILIDASLPLKKVVDAILAQVREI